MATHACNGVHNKDHDALVALGEGNLDREYTVKKEYTRVEGSSMYCRKGKADLRVRCRADAGIPALTRRWQSLANAADLMCL